MKHLCTAVIVTSLFLAPALPSWPAGETVLTNSGDGTGLSLASWAAQLAKLSGTRIDVSVTNRTASSLRIPAVWRSGRTLGRTLMDLSRICPWLKIVPQDNSYAIMDNPESSTSPPSESMDLLHHIFALAAHSGLAGGIVVQGDRSPGTILAPAWLPARDKLEEHLSNLGRWYGFFDYSLGDEALTVRLFDTGNVFSREIDDPDGTSATSGPWRKGVWYFTLGVHADGGLYNNSYDGVSQISLNTTGNMALEAGWFATDEIVLHAGFRTTELTHPIDNSSGGLIHCVAGAQYMFSLGFLQLSAGLGMMLDTVSADTLVVYTSSDPVKADGYLRLLFSARIWANLFDPFFFFVDLGLATNDYRSVMLALGFRL